MAKNEDYVIPIWSHISISSLIILFFVASSPRAEATADLSIADDGRTAGYVTLAWEEENPAASLASSYELQWKKGEEWEPVYEGTDTATTLSGLPDGRYAFRVKAEGQDWSPVFRIDIQHHSLGKALSFFAGGLVLFFLLCLLLFSRPSESTNSKA